jgi:hypothetical protein
VARHENEAPTHKEQQGRRDDQATGPGIHPHLVRVPVLLHLRRGPSRGFDLTVLSVRLQGEDGAPCPDHLAGSCHTGSRPAPSTTEEIDRIDGGPRRTRRGGRGRLRGDRMSLAVATGSAGLEGIRGGARSRRPGEAGSRSAYAATSA